MQLYRLPLVECQHVARRKSTKQTSKKKRTLPRLQNSLASPHLLAPTLQAPHNAWPRHAVREDSRALTTQNSDKILRLQPHLRDHREGGPHDKALHKEDRTVLQDDFWGRVWQASQPMISLYFIWPSILFPQLYSYGKPSRNPPVDVPQYHSQCQTTDSQ